MGHDRQEAEEKLRGKVIEELSAIAFADAAALMKQQENDGKKEEQCRPIGEMNRKARRCIESVSISGDKVSLKTASKLKALELLGKTIGLFREEQQKKGEEKERDAQITVQEEVAPWTE